MHPLSGLYAITPQLGDSNKLLEQTDMVLAGGTRIVQYRDKSDDQARRLQEAKALLELCHSYQVPLIINDDIPLARRINADGVHLGQQDEHILHARNLLGEDSIIGISCYDDFTLAQRAAADGADYVAFGAFYPSRSKPQAKRAGLDLLVRAKQQLAVPAVAIGGISLHNAAPLLHAGADMLAVIQGLFDSPEIQDTAAAFSELFDQYR